MDLSNIGKFVKDEERLVWAEFVPDFEVQLRYLSLPERTKTFERSQRTVLRSGKLQEEGAIRNLENLVVKMIAGWKLPVRVLAQLIEVQAADLGDPEAEVPCTDANKLVLIRRATGFAVWINNTASVLDNFRAEELGAEIENLSQS